MDFKKLKEICIPSEGSEAANVMDGIVVKKETCANTAIMRCQRQYGACMDGFPNSLYDVLSMGHNMSILLRNADAVENVLTPRELNYVAGQIDIMSAYLAFMADTMKLPAAEGV